MPEYPTCGLFVVCVAMAVAVMSQRADAGCHATRMCCPGRNNTCFTYGQKEGDVGVGDDRCFCDQDCSLMNDCCHDYRHACKATNCEVGGFSSWGECDNPCGIGVQVRRRKVRVFPENGGERCPVLKQRRGCIGLDYGVCLRQSIRHNAIELREVSRILPAKFSRFRQQEKFFPQRDPLRKNLFVNRGYDPNAILTRPSYCAYFEIIDHTCNETESWASALKVGGKVCLECQPIAMFKSLGMRCKGQGVFDEVTAFNAIGVHGCRGHWRMATKRDSCQCTRHAETDFILL